MVDVRNEREAVIGWLVVLFFNIDRGSHRLGILELDVWNVIGLELFEHGLDWRLGLGLYGRWYSLRLDGVCLFFLCR